MTRAEEVTVAVVNFHAAWGNKQANLQKMTRFVRDAAAQGAKIILFPELALTGYEVEPMRPCTRSCQKPYPAPQLRRWQSKQRNTDFT